MLLHSHHSYWVCVWEPCLKKRLCVNTPVDPTNSNTLPHAWSERNFLPPCLSWLRARILLSICKSETGNAVVPLSQWAANVHSSSQLVVNLSSTPQPLSTPLRDPLLGSHMQPLVWESYECPWVGPTQPSVCCPRNGGSQETLALTLMLLTYLLNCLPWLWITLKP